MVVAVDVTLDVTVKNVTNVIKWDILHANAKKMLIDATDAMVIYWTFLLPTPRPQPHTHNHLQHLFFSHSNSGTGHIARDCSQSPDDPCCYNCNKTGHIARNCPDQDRQRERDREERGSGGMSCYICNKSGHIKRNCPESQKSCYSCGKSGHLSRDCNQNGGRN